MYDIRAVRGLTRPADIMEWYRSGHNEHDWKSCDGQKPSEGSNPSRCATSEQALYRLLRLTFNKYKSERAHAAAPPFQAGTANAGLRFGFAASRRFCFSLENIDFNRHFHAGAKSALLRRSFLRRQKRTPSVRSLVPPFQLQPAALGSQLAGRPVSGIFSIKKYRF